MDGLKEENGLPIPQSHKTVCASLMRKSLNQRFVEMSRLYHFTSFDSACKIIGSKRLRFGKAYRMNDLIESNRMVFDHILSSSLLKDSSLYAEREMKRYQQLSFVQDKEYDEVVFLGFDLHSMWGLYADKGYGVCLVFDKGKLAIGANDYANDVKYRYMVPESFAFKNKSKPGLKAEIWKKKDDIFFNKRKEWKYEQEYRIIRRAQREDSDEYLDISDSLSFAIICKDYSVELEENISMFDGDHFDCLRSLDRRLPILTYENGLDGYSLFKGYLDPIWTEQCGYM